MGCSKSSSQRKIYVNKQLHKEKETSEINNLRKPQGIRRSRTKPKVRRRKEIKSRNK